ncbi:MAG TPA: PAS domain-containing protein, partial [Anaerolineae bacterium]|nr:PAS domain-containing protein [Anaerolineae bacterium]HIQ05143.1 PAS domain-containing protein [Anaerolineae bacterium]
MLTDYQLRQREYLLEISRAMTSRLDLPSLLRLILTAAAEMVGADVGLIALKDSHSDDSFRTVATYGLPARLLPRFHPLLTDIPLLVEAQRYAGWQIPNLSMRLQLVAHEVGLPLHQVIALPLVFEDELLGLIYLFRTGGIAFSANDRSVLDAFADQAAIAVRNARLYQQVSEEKRRLDAIIEHSANGVMILDPDRRIRVFNRALEALTGWPREDAIGRPCYQVIALRNAQGHDVCSAERPADLPEKGHLYVEGDIIRPGGSRVTVGIT